MVGKAERMKIGTFVRNILTSNARYRDLALDLGVNRSIDPEYLLDYLEREVPKSDFVSIISETKNSSLKDVAMEFLEERGYVSVS